MRTSVLATMLLLVAFVAGCKTPPSPPPPIAVPKFQCLTAPSGLYRAGTVVRTVDGASTAGKVPADDLTVAWAPIGTVISDNYVDVEQEVRGGLSAALTTAALGRLGATASLSADATYSVSLSAKSNTNFVADDDVRLATLNAVRSKEGLLPTARYFFVKEALGSEDLSYVVKSKVAAVAKAELKARDSSLSADVTARDATSAVRSKKVLIACVLLEEMTVSIYTASNGNSVLTYRVEPGRLSEADLAVVEKATKAK